MLADGFTQLEKTEMDTNMVPHQQRAEVHLTRATTANVTTGFWDMVSEEAAKDMTTKKKRKAKEEQSAESQLNYQKWHISPTWCCNKKITFTSTGSTFYQQVPSKNSCVIMVPWDEELHFTDNRW